MDELNKNIIYSEPIKEIMGHVPPKILKKGSTIVSLVFIAFILLLWLIKYPDTIPAPVEITTANPPVTMVSKITGRIKYLYVTDGERINSGQMIAVMETAASVDDINKLRHLSDTIDDPGEIMFLSLPVFSELGELQSYWSSFLKSLSDYANYNFNDFYGHKITALSEEIENILIYIGRVKIKEKLFTENKLLEEKKFKRDSLLFVNGVFSESDLEKSRQELIRLKIELEQVRLDYSAKSIELAERRQLLQDYMIRKQEEKVRYYSVLNESFLNLKAQLKIWENTYLLISPITGTVTFTKFWSENQTVIKDEPVLSVVPSESGDYVGRINLRMNRSGKVKLNQVVNIKLSGYPYLEFGMIRGIITSKSLVPAGDSYIIELSLPSGLTTLYGKKLEFTQNMQGKAEIITDDLRLIHKILDPFRYLISRNKR